MEVVNYEERYPTVVTERNTSQNYEEQFPTVVNPQNSPQHYLYAATEEQAPKYSVHYPLEYKKPLTPVVTDVYPEVAPQSARDPAYPNAVPPKGEVPCEPLIASRRKYCGLGKKTFLIALVLFAIIVVGAVGGAIGSIVARKNRKESASNASSGTGSSGVDGNGSVPTAADGSGSTSTPTLVVSSGVSASLGTNPTATSVATTLDTTKNIGSLAVSTFQATNNKVYVHMYYQQGSNIAYRIYPGSGYFSTAQALPLVVAPKDGTPLTAVEYGDSTTSHMSLFYLDTYNNIICANFSSSLTSTTLTLTKSLIAAANTTSSIHPSSQLAAIYIPSGTSLATSYRLYYQTLDSTLQGLVGSGGSWKAGTNLAASAVVGSALTISLGVDPAPLLNLFYIDSTTNSLFTINWGNSGTSAWGSPTALSSTALTKFNGSSTTLTAIAESEPSYMRTYYIGSDLNIYEMLGNPLSTNVSWSKNSDVSVNPKWPVADNGGPGGLVGIGWRDQVRIYYITGGKVEQLNLGNQTWTVSSNLGGGST